MKGTKARSLIGLFLVVASVLAVSGCMVAMRGRDYGSWSGKSEPVPLTSLHGPGGAQMLSRDQRLLVLPLLAELPAETLANLRRALAEQARIYFPCRIRVAEAEGPLAEYVARTNLHGGDGQFNVDEIARLGRYLDATHVLAAYVRSARFYPPQDLELVIIVVEARTSRMVVEMTAGFPASDQRTIAALGQHLDRRLARKYDRTSLDLILRSPSGYSRFAFAECCRVLSEHLWKAGDLSRSEHVPTSTETHEFDDL